MARHDGVRAWVGKALEVIGKELTNVRGRAPKICVRADVPC